MSNFNQQSYFKSECAPVLSHDKSIIDLGSCPCLESCSQLGSENYEFQAKRETKAYKAQLLRMFPIPEGLPVKYSISANQHDFGVYYSLILLFDSKDEAACDYVFLVDNSLPEEWDAEAKEKLGLKML